MKIIEIYIGQQAKLSHTITKADVTNFISLTGDSNSIHTGENGIVHGMLVASFISTVIGTRLPGNGALWKSQNIRFISPVRVGDTITVMAEVYNIDISNSEIVLLTDVYNQRGDAVIMGTSIVRVSEE